MSNSPAYECVGDVEAALEVAICDLLDAAGPLTAATIEQRLRIDTRNANFALRRLVAAGLLALDGDQYRLLAIDETSEAA